MSLNRFAATVVLAASVLLPALAFSPQGQTTYRWNDGLHLREMKFSGDLEFTDDESDVLKMSPGAFLSCEESYGYSGRRFTASMESNGQIVRKYYVDGREKPFDDQARAWLRATLPNWLRESPSLAPVRVQRFLKQGGVPAALAEVAKIHSGSSKRAYIRELVPSRNPNHDQMETILRLVRAIDSDGDKAATLCYLVPYALKDNLADYFF